MGNRLITRPISVAQLNALRAQVAKNPVAAYLVLPSHGYGYAGLAMGVAGENYISGQIAVDYAMGYASSIGHT